jgi:hypothetical protein
MMRFANSRETETMVNAGTQITLCDNTGKRLSAWVAEMSLS